MVNRRSIRRDKDIDVWKRRQSLMRQCCANRFGPAGPPNMPLFRHVDEIAYLCRLSALFRKHREDSTEKGGLDWSSFCSFEQSYDKFYLVCDAMDWWHELSYEFLTVRQCANVMKHRIVGWLNLKMFVFPLRERGLFYQVFQNVWAE